MSSYLVILIAPYLWYNSPPTGAVIGKKDAPGLQTPAQTPALNVTADPSCFDDEAGCPAWAEGDGCIQTGPAFMLDKCRRSCGVCGRPYIRRPADKVRALSTRTLKIHLEGRVRARGGRPRAVTDVTNRRCLGSSSRIHISSNAS